MTTESTAADREREALENCDRDPIHLVGAIQPFAWLLATDRSVSEFRYVSANIASLLNLAPPTVFAASPDDILAADVIHALRNIASHQTITHQREFVHSTTLHGNTVDLVAHVADDSLIIEAQIATDDQAETLATMRETQQLFGRVGPNTDLNQLLDRAVNQLQGITGHDRVMAYRFLPDGAGEVIAERSRAGFASYKGLRFPAFDIPPQARRLFLSTPIRIIENTNGTDVPIVAASDELPPLDLSLALSRATAAAHSLYLQNMGVQSTLTLPIIVAGELWGLFSFHHHSRLEVTAPTALAAELAGRLLSLLIDKQLQLVTSAGLAATWKLADHIVAFVNGSQTLDWEQLSTQLLDFADAQGVAVLDGPRVIATSGIQPPPEATPNITSAIIGVADQTDSGSTYTTNQLPAQCDPPLTIEELNGCAGVALVRSAGTKPITVAFYRSGAANQVSWAGAPTKDLQEVDGELQLAPRASFNAYIETHDDRSDDWTPDQHELFNALLHNLTHSTLSNEALVRSNEHLQLMVRELNHRVRNVLALVSSISRRSRESSDSIELFVTQLQQRITALAIAHDLLTANEWTNISLNHLAQRAGDAFVDTAEENFTIEGPNTLTLNAEAATIIALLLYELASNASRHGSLSVPDGKVNLSWSHSGDDVIITWRESNGPTVAVPTRRGFGTTIIEQAVPSELDGTATVDFDPAGLVVTTTVPRASLEGVDPPDDLAMPDIERMRMVDLTAPIDLEKGRALVVEDSFLIRDDVVATLSNLGFGPVDSCATVDEALDLLSTTTYGFAVLDVNLRGTFVGPVATRLAQLGTPFIFATGLGSKDQLLHDYPALATLTKPVTPADIAELLERIDATHRSRQTTEPR